MNFLLQKRGLLRWQRKRWPEPQNYLARSRTLMWKNAHRHAQPQKFLCKKSVLTYRAPERFGGAGYIAGQAEGIVTVAGLPASRRILLFSRENFMLVKDIWSAEDGTYRFSRINENKDYIVIALDHARQYEPVAYDFVRPALPQVDGKEDG